MRKKTFILISSSLLLSSGFVVVLFLTSFDFSKQDNDFVRLFVSHPVLEQDTLDLWYNSYYIAGATDHTVYLGNVTAPLHVVALNMNSLSDSVHFRIDVKSIDEYKFWSLKLKVDSPYFSLLDGAVPVIFGGRTDNWKADRYMYDSAYFTDAIPFSYKSFAIRTVPWDKDEYVLGKLQDKSPHVILNRDLLEKQVDGRFCVDGKMVYDKKLKKLVYLYYYRNQYVVTDSNLNLLYRGNTIDTVSRAKIKVGDIDSENSRTLSTPPYIVNKNVALWDNWLFVSSALIANNELPETFYNATVIDVYDQASQAYKFSFYLYDFKESKVRGFIASENKLVVLYEQDIMVYSLTNRLFERSLLSMN